MAYYNEHLNKFYIEFLDFQNIISIIEIIENEYFGF